MYQINITFNNPSSGKLIYFSGSSVVPSAASFTFVNDEGIFSYLDLNAELRPRGGIIGSGSLRMTGSMILTGAITSSLREGFALVGGAGNITTVVATSSFGGGGTGAGFPFSGSAQITGSLGVTGSISVSGSYLITSQSFTGSLIDNVSPTTTNVAPVRHVISITSASYAALATKDPNTLYVVSGSAITGSGIVATSAFPFTGSAIISGSLIVTGSVFGNVISASIASNTASIDFNAGNFYTSLVTGTTFFNITGVNPGETCNLLLTTVGRATASFSSNVKQVSGSRYLPTSGSSRIDILTFVSFDSSNVYLAKLQNFV